MVDLTEDIVELQTKVQFQEDIIQKLDEVVIRQARQLDLLMRRLAVLEDRLEQIIMERDNPAAVAEPRPPHY
ncbi:MAG: SlyX family protein [Gammaproteobacteria bacterium]|jgi:SlyX protein